jgi:hypothetical protein
MYLGQNINLLNLDLSISNDENPYTYFNNNNIYPSTDFLKKDKNNIDTTLKNTLLKRACCMRDNNKLDSNNIVL